MRNKLKILIKFVTYFCIDFLIKPSKNTKENSLLLIRLDAIGDYILFRNYIEILKKSEKYREYQITLLGNSAWKNLSEELDYQFIDKFIWIDREPFMTKPTYRYQKLQEIVSENYEVVINPIYSREFFVGDNIVKLLFAKEKIASVGDLSNIKPWQKKISDKYYTKLIPAKNEVIFEFTRNKEFFENLLNMESNIIKPHIDLKTKKLPFKLPRKYAILFIGASARYRKWSIESFVTIGKYLKNKYNYEIVLCGAPSDVYDAIEFKKKFDESYVDLVGKTNLIDLLYVIRNGNLMIANETSAPHFAVALEMTNIFVISNGNHYGRFTPYTKDITPNYHAIYHPIIQQDLDNYKKLSNNYGYGSDLDINEISVEMVQEKISEVLNAK